MTTIASDLRSLAAVAEEWLSGNEWLEEEGRFRLSLTQASEARQHFLSSVQTLTPSSLRAIADLIDAAEKIISECPQDDIGARPSPPSQWAIECLAHAIESIRREIRREKKSMPGFGVLLDRRTKAKRRKERCPK